ncbi:MAG TPA: CpcT/CpeT family chromophore lyase [Steroidobacteraceae bacterium]|nr:CpcT/CpeT family chromophore lyase [Steroidobacteraceae bacterium]HNS27027.1 CpcT/CpeT family chromophore lyase [Steroidobacteraceae bacterium]
MVERGLALIMLALLGACSSTADLRKAELSELAAWLPGTYVNGARELAFVPIYAPFISDNVFFTEESSTQGGRRVLSQRVIAFEVVDKQIVQASYAFAEPGRWRAGLYNPDLFKGLMEQDLKVQAGCEMLWVKDVDAGKFAGANDRKQCRASRASGALAFLEVRAELTPDDFARAERYYNAGGRLLSGSEDDELERWRKSE